MCRATRKALGLQKVSVPWEHRGGMDQGWVRQAENQTRLGKVSVGRLSLTRELTCRSCNQFVL